MSDKSVLSDFDILDIYNGKQEPQTQGAHIVALRAVAEAAIAADRAARAEPVECGECGGTGDVSGEYPGVTCRMCNGHGHAAPPAAPVVSGDTIDAVSKALRRAWQLGQTYCRQADQEFVSYHRKADETRAKFDALVEDTLAMLYTAPPAAPVVPEDVANDAERYRWLKSRMIGVDFDWSEQGITALSFEMPDGCAFGGNCDQNIDNAMLAAAPAPSQEQKQ